MPALGLERKFSIERPPETGEQETKQDTADWESLPSGVVKVHKITSTRLTSPSRAVFRIATPATREPVICKHLSPAKPLALTAAPFRELQLRPTEGKITKWLILKDEAQPPLRPLSLEFRMPKPDLP